MCGCGLGCSGRDLEVVGVSFRVLCGCYSGNVGVMWVFFNTLIVNVFVTKEYRFLIYEYTLNQV